MKNVVELRKLTEADIERWFEILNLGPIVKGDDDWFDSITPLLKKVLLRTTSC